MVSVAYDFLLENWHQKCLGRYTQMT